MNGTTFDVLSDISETLLLPLYSRAIESKSKDPIIVDEKAIEITEELNKIFKNSDKQIHQKLVKGKIPKKLPITLSLRTRRFDRYVLDTLNNAPDAIIVNMGCGLDTRFTRVDNGSQSYQITRHAPSSGG